MDSHHQEEAIRYAGGPFVSEQGREVLSFHLHRYLSAWLAEVDCTRVLVTVGFEGSDAELGAYRIDARSGESVESGWTHADLDDAWRYGNSQILWDAGDGDPIAFDVVPVFEKGEDRPIGFVTVRRDEGLDDRDLEQMADLVATAIAMSRRNGVRLFFDEQQDRPVKELLYATMNRLPEWTGCDHSAAVLLTHDLDAMTLADIQKGAFNVLAERVFFDASRGEDDKTGGERLVGMAVDAGAGQENFLSDALRHYQSDPSLTHLIYRRIGEEENIWRRADGEDRASRPGWHGLSDRPRESMVVLVPLVQRAGGERDLFGFLSLAWRGAATLPASAQDVFGEMADALARLLRHSPLYTLSVRKMWVIRKVRDCIEEALRDGQSGGEAVEALIGAVVGLVAEHVEVPSFSMGYVRGERGARTARYVHPWGWTRFDDLDLAVDVAPEDRVDSGISALALRLERPVVLAGGHGAGRDLAFKNHLWVDEENRRLFDSRGIDHCDHSEEDLRRWARPLREYYKPARESAYASLAYPMIFADRPVGILSVEVERDTDWLWWTGFGGHLFWDMVARQVGMGIHLLTQRG